MTEVTTATQVQSDPPPPPPPDGGAAGVAAGAALVTAADAQQTAEEAAAQAAQADAAARTAAEQAALKQGVSPEEASAIADRVVSAKLAERDAGKAADQALAPPPPPEPVTAKEPDTPPAGVKPAKATGKSWRERYDGG